jgi:heptosyltransferase-2
MHFLIVKRGALGDVVRTSYFAGSLKRKHGAAFRLSWITARESADLLRLNPHIDDLWFGFDEATTHRFDRIFSLDDELDTLEGVARLHAASITGAMLRDGHVQYSDDSAEWFDMGLHSRYGKERADELKKLNRRSHAQIFTDIFGVDRVAPAFYLDESCRRWARTELPSEGLLVGINPYSGGRWPSKELRLPELERLLSLILAGASPFVRQPRVILLGAGSDFGRNQALASKYPATKVLPLCTDTSVQHLAAAVGCLDYLITSDSLALHLGVSQGIPFTAFFSPTSAAEIDDWGIGTKVTSTAPDYCSYRRDADNTTITADRILDAVAGNPVRSTRGTSRNGLA